MTEENPYAIAQELLAQNEVILKSLKGECPDCDQQEAYIEELENELARHESYLADIDEGALETAKGALDYLVKANEESVAAQSMRLIFLIEKSKLDKDEQREMLALAAAFGKR